MTIAQFSDQVLIELEAIIGTDKETNSEGAVRISAALFQLLKKLQSFINTYTFETINEEIRFFKFIKPKFLTRFIYYRKIFKLLSEQPNALKEDIRKYYIQQLQTIKNEQQDYNELLTYYRSGSELLDEIYFTRKEPDIWLLLSSKVSGDENFSTPFDHQLSKLLANEEVSNFIIDKIDMYAHEQRDSGTGTLSWTASKAALIELLYALQSNGSCNNGAVDVKDLARYFEKIFNIKLGNFYRTFQEIRIRKISRTTFLDQLKDSLIKRMDISDENPRF